MHRLGLGASAISLLSLGAQAAIGPVSNISVVNKVIAPDGFQRDTVLVDGTFPGPPLLAKKGDSFEINALNLLHDTTMDTATTIHWHGIHQLHSNDEDGTAFVTQCPIIPNNTFPYNFRVPDQAGTFWYHSHLSTQYCDGLRGAMILYDPDDPYKHWYDVDDESTIITLADWYHTPSPSAGYIPFPDSNLINGRGRYWGGPQVPLSVVEVQYGKRYRFRLLSMTCHPNYIFSIDGHNFTIIEADGVNTEPLVVDSIQIYAAQRYSLIVYADKPVNNYWIRALPNQGNITTDGGLNSAILRYAGAPEEDPTTVNTTSIAPFVETNLHALTNPTPPGKPYPGGADYNLDLVMYANLTGYPHFQMNGYTFTNPTMPVLLQILSGAQTAQDLLPTGAVYTLPPNSSIEVSFSSAGAVKGFPHPFHLHGHDFYVVRSAGNTSYNYINPVRRDTVNVGGADGTDNATIRFYTDNTGPWFLHCHIDWHLALGMAVVFAENPAGTAAYAPVTKAWDSLCPEYHSWEAKNASVISRAF